MSVVTEKRPADLTQEEVYALYGRYAGCLDAKAQSQLEHLLEFMGYPEELVGDVRVEAGDRLYFPAARALELLQRQAAAGAPEKPPPEPRPRRRTRAQAARDAVVERATVRKEWAELLERAKQPTEVKK